MKRLLVFIGLLCLLCLPALAEDISKDCKLYTSKSRTLPKLVDRDYKSTWTGSSTITVEARQDIRGLYLNWAARPKGFSLEGEQGGQWRSLHEAGQEPAFAHEYVDIPEGYSKLRLKPSGSAKLSEIYVFGGGELPAFVQRWEPTLESCDLMLLVAHPDDEVVMFGGTLPTYAGELRKRVTVATMTAASPRRVSELLNSLWTCGLRTYPVIGNFPDKYFKSASAASQRWGARNARAFVVELFRRYKPQVVLTHDQRGEYGHGAHMYCAELARSAYSMAAEADKYVSVYEKHGPWQVQKLYWHLGKKDASFEMDWDQPLSAFQGKTGFEVAKEAYQHHKSQHQFGFPVYPRDSRYSSYRYSLVLSQVGPDLVKKDFLENIPVQP